MGTPIELNDEFYSVSTFWWHNRVDNLKDRYKNGEIELSPYLHEKVYKEKIPDKKEWTPSVENHVMIFWGPAGNININDYRYIPKEFRVLFWDIVSGYHPKKGNSIYDAEQMTKYLKNKYNITDGLSDILVWYYLSNEQTRSVLQET